MGGISVLFLFGIFSALFYFILATIFIVLVYLLLSYIFESIAIGKMCKSLNYKHAYTSWIPFYNKFLLGRIASHKKLGAMLAIINFSVITIFIFLYNASSYSGLFLIFFFVLIILSFILNIVISHDIFKKAIGAYADILTIFSVLSLGLLRPIFLFVLRNNKKINELKL